MFVRDVGHQVGTMLKMLATDFTDSRLRSGVVFLVLVGPERVFEPVLLTANVTTVTKGELFPFLFGSSLDRRSFRWWVLRSIMNLFVVLEEVVFRDELKTALRTLMEARVVNGIGRESLILGIITALRVLHADVTIE